MTSPSVAYRRRSLELLDQIAGVGAVAAGDGLQIHLHPLADLLPGGLQILPLPLGPGLWGDGAAGAAPAGPLPPGLAGLRLLAGGLPPAAGSLPALDGQVPGPVVVRQEMLPQTGHLIGGQVPVQEVAVELLSRQGPDLGAELLERLLSLVRAPADHVGDLDGLGA